MIIRTILDIVDILDEMSTLAHNNGKIEYEIHTKDSESSKSTIVFIHGFCLDRRQWKPQVEELVEKGYRVLTYDMRGFGESSPPLGKYSHADDLEALLEHLNIEGAEICGHSFGGEVALDFAASRPDMTEGLILLASSLGSYGADSESPIPRWSELAREGEMDTVKRELLAHESLKSMDEHSEEYALLETIINEYSGWHFIHEDSGESTWGVVNRLSEIRCPVKIISGEKDSELSHEISNKLSKELANSELLTFEGAGHFLNLEEPKLVNEAIGLFIEDREGQLGEGRLSAK